MSLGSRAAAARASLRKARQWRTRSGICPPIGTGAHLKVRRWTRRALGVDVHLTPPPGYIRITKSTMRFELEADFNRLVDEGLQRTGAAPDEGEGRLRQRQKLYSLLEAFDLTTGVDGVVAECGCYRGLSAYLLCCTMAASDAGFKGEGVHLFDSFEGLSAPAAEDQITDKRVPKGKVKRQAGMFSASVDDVRRTLSDFPDVELHKGWIPGSLAEAPPGLYRFVHLDLDLHDPTREGLAFFYERLAPGGVLVCDDYGAVRWPGVRTAVDAFCESTGARRLRLAAGQAVIFPPVVPASG